MLRGLLICSLPALLASTAGAQESKPVESDWWAYQPVVRPAVPVLENMSWVRSPIDAFILAGLEAKGLQPAPPADRHALLRRVTYDLTGLPPTQTEIDAFIADESPDAYAKVLDRLLASQQYGVKWAQHWLDLVRYAETEGYERDNKKPFVWRYRDWVVDALNADMPYGDFVTKQLAGDELPDAKVADHIATGFFRLGTWDDEPTDRPQHLYDDYDGMADTTARGMLAISMGCARCHDHKKDPLPHRDYHSFLSFFENVAPYDMRAREMPLDGAKVQYDEAMKAYRASRGVVQEKLKLRAREADRAALELASSGIPSKVTASPHVASYSGDEASPTELLDAYGNNGTVHGQVVQVDGKRGQALRFDGDDHCRIPRIVENSFTVSFFVRTKQRGNGQSGDTRWFTGTGLVDGEVPGIVDDWGISWHSDGIISAGTGKPEKFVASGPGYNDGEWHHVAFTRDQESGRIVLYVDGQLVGEARGSKRSLNSPEDIVIGRMRPGGAGFKGDIDELSFYKAALTQPQVIALSCDAAHGIFAAPFFAEETLVNELNALRSPKIETVQVLAVLERGRDAPDAFIRLRGNVHAKGEQVPVGVPEMLGEPRLAPFEKLEHSSGRRLALASWIVRPDNRLTWRVIANRLWQHHFGRGIVSSSNDFGVLGTRPTHPKLLDWLACEVVEQGSSLKAMHRVMMMSSTYRMSSQASEKGLAEDPLNDSFWRFNRRRLTAEEVRDSILTANGTINLELGGPSVYPPLPRAVLLTASRPDAAWGQSNARQAARRSIYIHVKRSLPEPLLAAFDRADTDASCPVRFATVQPTQALSMINGDFANLQAQRFADRLMLEQKDMASRLHRALQLVSQREPTKVDLQRLQQLAGELQGEFGRSELQALQRCCLVLLNCNEFLFID
ncbi:MAG: hypothetical protein ACI8UD_002836 [Planctomycetota bacterium]|jgi:hypothetical protein